ncbi:CTTNBP2 N-terminal-like protein isoform X2 [Lethenteron reissneri]|uniref:CTTNBP2 N-terminal-like protein isoform X2 n=1 Tax=Lethenteron reissneri TaxID=7753 RepID=UPI002AB7D423|nr:CTTNBP2 N-terminal-like protein isoform X2 [Lethenteron reissneri]
MATETATPTSGPGPGPGVRAGPRQCRQAAAAAAAGAAAAAVEEGHVGQLDMENLSRPQMLSLLSFLEGELEARDLAIEAHSREEFMHERYGRYRLGDPLRALQRDWELGEAGDGGDEGTPAGSPGGTPGGSRHRLSTPAALLDTVVQQWRRTRDRVTARLAAIESQHCKVMKELEDERRRHAQDLAQGDDVTFMLEKERERLEQQVDFEKSQVKKLEKEQKKLSAELREERAKSKQLVLMLVKENELLTEQLQKERSALAERDTGLAEEKRRSDELGDLLEVHKKKSGQVEAELEKQLAEFDTEREQLRLKLEHEAHHSRGLQEEILGLKSGLASKDRSDGAVAAAAEAKTTSSKCVEAKPPVRSVGAGSDEAPATLVSTAAGTDAPPAAPVAIPAWDASCPDGAPAATAAVAAKPREPRNGPESHAAHAGSNHARPVRRAGETDLNRNAAAGEAPRSPGEPLVKVTPSSCFPSEASPPRAAAPVPDDEELSSARHLELSNSHDAPSAGAPARAGRGVAGAATAGLSPRSLSPHSPSGLGDGSPTAASPDPLRSGYSAGLNSRFQVAKLKFQTQVEQEQQQQQQLQVQQQQQLQVSSVTVHGPTSPDATGARRDSSPVKNLARNTVSQAISRFASQQAAAMAAGKTLPLGGSSPFGTDYRSALHSPAPGAAEPAHALHPPGRAGGNPLLSPSSPSAPGGGGGGVKGPSVSLRLDRGAPPPIPPKKPSLIQGSHAATATTATGAPARSLAVDSNSNPSVEPLELEGEGTRHNAVGSLASALELPNAAVAAAAGATSAAATTCSDGCGTLPARSASQVDSAR